MFTTPVLLITFNRPNHTLQVWNEIKKQKPKQVFVFQDGARNDDDLGRINAVRALFEEKLDWNCELKTYFSDINLGCGKGPVTGISWFFSQVEQGIIFEDDCLPHPDCFKFCEILLNKYQQDSRVMAIGTTTYLDDYPCIDSYCFSRYFTGGAWASWAQTWNYFDMDLTTIEEKLFREKIARFFYSSAETNWWTKKLVEIQNDRTKKSYWDYQMQIHILDNDGVVVRPHNNMISNIGFDPEGTHTVDNSDNRGYRAVHSNLPLQHPEKVIVDSRNDYLYMAKEHQKKIYQRTIAWIYEKMNTSSGVFKSILNQYKCIKTLWKKA